MRDLAATVTAFVFLAVAGGASAREQRGDARAGIVRGTVYTLVAVECVAAPCPSPVAEPRARAGLTFMKPAPAERGQPPIWRGVIRTITATDEGRYRIALRPGTYSVVIDGKAARPRAVFVRAGRTLRVDFRVRG